MSRWAIGIDIGGTFTDLVALDHQRGEVHSLKVLTTHGDPADGVMDGVARLIEQADIDPGRVGRVVHATTLFTNAIIERRGARTGLLVTRGFRDVLEIGNERKYELYDLTLEQAPPLVPRELRVEVDGRIGADGHEIEPLDEVQLQRAVAQLVAHGVESVAVCLLHAYAYPAQERQLRAWIERDFPQLQVMLSSEVAPIIREFERMSTTVASAFIKPLATRYLDTLERRLQQRGLPAGVQMMLSNGGLSHIDQAKRNPIELLESGPAAGAISAAHFSLRDGQPDLLAFDMGGTTAKLCLVERGQPSIAFGFEAARRKRFAEGSGLPVKITAIDLIEIGAGGGSIASLDGLGLLKVGPESAGSEPGPACYGRGGQEATVTDANLLLGYLNPDYFAGGTMAIDIGRARAALERVASVMQRDLTSVAWGMHDIVAENMAGAARVHVAERGRDPADFVLLCTGGGGPLHAYYVAQKIGVRTIVCPPAAGVASAYGLLVAPARADRSRTASFRPGVDALELVETAFEQLEAQVRDALAPLDAAFGPLRLTRQADGRFAGQGFNLTVPLPAGPYVGGSTPQQAVRDSLLAAFTQGYREKYGRTPPDVAVELVNLRVAGEAPPRQNFEGAALAESGPAPEPRQLRQVYFREAGGYVDTPVFDRGSIGAGFTARGPLILEEAGSSLVVGPRGRVEQRSSGNLIVHIEEQAR